jgi:hypothetical protein
MKTIHRTLFRRRKVTCTRSAESCCKFVLPTHFFGFRVSERSTESDRESALPLLRP